MTRSKHDSDHEMRLANLTKKEHTDFMASAFVMTAGNNHCRKLDAISSPLWVAGEARVEGFEGGEVELPDEELIADAAEKSFDLSLRGGVADGRVAQEAADAAQMRVISWSAVDGAVVDEELLGDAAFVEGGANRPDQGVDVLLEEELAVAEDAAGVVDEGDELGLFA